MERARETSLALFFAPELPDSGSVTLGEDAAHHIRVRRLEPGEIVGLRDGAGRVARGALVRVAKNVAVVDVTSAEAQPPAEPVHLLVPIADRDRMLWLAEKATELGVTSWRPVMWRRSRSVTPRGEGPGFQAKVRARMISAMLQSGSAWLPALYPDATIESAILAAPEGSRLVLDGTGAPVLLGAENVAAPVTLAIGPEGGFELDELDRMRDAGFTAVSLGHSILRFETAGVAAAAVARALLASRVAHAPASAGGDSHLED